MLFLREINSFGELDATETICHLIVTGEMQECVFSVPSPFDENTPIDLFMTLNKNTKNDVKFVNGSPYITVDAKLDARILSSSENSNYFVNNNYELIEDYASSYIKSNIENYLYKTSKEYKSDIALFGKYAVSHFNTWDKWTSYNWLNNYTNSFFKVNVDVNVLSSYLIS